MQVSKNLKYQLIKRTKLTFTPNLDTAGNKSKPYLHNVQQILKMTYAVFTLLYRRRTLVSMGTHDLDTVQGPFIYDARPPADIKFKALSQTQEYTAVELMTLYSVSPYLV